MDTDRLLEMACYAGKLLIESGAEVYRVEETVVRLCESFSEVQNAESFVTLTGIMCSVTVNNHTYTKISRVRSRGVDLNCIDKVNDLSRRASNEDFSVEEVYEQLCAIGNEKRYPFWMRLLFSALSAGGFAIFFHGTLVEAICSFLVGFIIQLSCWICWKLQMNGFFTNVIGAAVAALGALFCKLIIPTSDVDTVIISSIMLLVPGLAITNAIRDSVSGDYLSGLARAMEAVLTAVAIAVGVGFVLSVAM